jgi:LacI family transcriptional regulator
MRASVQTYRGSKTNRLTGQLRRQIEAGSYAPGDRLPSVSEMRASCGAAPLTVQRVYQQLEKEGLVVREQGRGTFVTRKRARTGVIGCVGDGFFSHDPYWTHLARGIRESAQARDQELLFLKSAPNAGGWDMVDGVLVCSARPAEALQHCGSQLPRVALVFDIANEAGVTSDDENSAWQAVRYLLDRGHRRIAFLHNGHPVVRNTVSYGRLCGYRRALAEAGIKPANDWLLEVENPANVTAEFGLPYAVRGRRRMEEWLENGWRQIACTALLAHNDDVAIGAMQVLQSAGYSIPKDVSVIGFDGTELGEYVRPRLTSLHVPLGEIAHAGMELLLRQIETQVMAPEKIVLPATLEERDSVRPPR